MTVEIKQLREPQKLALLVKLRFLVQLMPEIVWTTLRCHEIRAEFVVRSATSTITRFGPSAEA
jgi:hypothetical protein